MLTTKKCNTCTPIMNTCKDAVNKCSMYSCGILVWNGLTIPTIPYIYQSITPTQYNIDEFVDCVGFNDLPRMEFLVGKYPKIINMSNKVSVDTLL